MICRICKNDYPATAEYFHRHKHNKGGLHYECKKCAIKIVKDWQKTYSNTGEYIENNKKRCLAWQQSNPEKRKAQKLIWANPNCVKIIYECPCVSNKKVLHHFDYSKPYDVIKLCVSCHWREHHRLRLLAAQAANNSSTPEVIGLGIERPADITDIASTR